MEITFALNTIEELKNWFNQAGWLANALTIIPVFFALLLGLWKMVKFFLEDRSFQDIAKRHFSKEWSTNSIKELAEIAIVDDNLSDFPVGELRKAGYRVKTYKQVSLSDISVLSSFDLVFLDMHGIVRDDLSEGGLRLIAQLRSTNPRQKICAVSSKTFDPTASAFFKQADDVQKKPISAQKCREVIDSLVGEKLEPFLLATKIDAVIKKLPVQKRRRLLKAIVTTRGKSLDLSENIFDESLKEQDSTIKLMIGDFFRMTRHGTGKAS